MDPKLIIATLRDITEAKGRFFEIASGDIDPSWAAGDEDLIEEYLQGFLDLAATTSCEFENWLDGEVTAQSALQEISNAFETMQLFEDDVEILDCQLRSELEKYFALINSAVSTLQTKGHEVERGRSDYYVYTHTDPRSGQVFYVGKGTGRRAWNKDREPEWLARVDDIGGNYKVDIVKDGLTNTEAENLEFQLIVEYEDTLVNKVKPLATLRVEFD